MAISDSGVIGIFETARSVAWAIAFAMAGATPSIGSFADALGAKRPVHVGTFFEEDPDGGRSSTWP